MTLAQLNRCDQQRFVDALGWIFERSPWVAQRAWKGRPFDNVAELHEAMVAAVLAAGRSEQLALLCAHPDLGARVRMSDASAGEQAGAGLDRLTAEEFETLQRLPAEYRQTFGFPFLLAVKGRTKQEVIAALERRLQNTAELEWGEALRQVGHIAELRLRDVIG
jgi:OHCU decarboxylase